MIGKSFLLIGFIVGTLHAAPPSRELQELRLNLEHVDRTLHSHRSEIDLFHDRMQTLERSIEQLTKDFKSPKQGQSAEKRLSALEKAQEALAGDLKTLKNHLNETSSSVAKCQSKLSNIDKQLTSDIKSLNQSIQSMVAILQGSEDPSKSYIVQAGDSLGQIAIDHKTDLKTLKSLNNLASDTIYVGQKLLLP